MDLNNQLRPEDIGPNFIDLRSILKAKGINAPGFVIKFMNRLLHVKELNHAIYTNREFTGLELVDKFLKESLQFDVEVVNPENIPLTGSPIISGNHPLGGPDGMALLSAIGKYRKDVLFPVNDFLMAIPGLRCLFIPVDKIHHESTHMNELRDAFAGNNTLLYFPAGLCSRRKKGVIKDLEWKNTFIRMSKKHHRDVVPVFIDAHNRNRFYTIANLRKSLGIKFGFEMALLPSEMFAQKGKCCRIIVGKPIPYTTFDNSHTLAEWSVMVKEHVYTLKENPSATFIAK